MDLGFDGNIKVGFVPAIADIDAPTVAELNAGVDLEGRLLPDGLSTPSDTTEVPNTKMRGTFDTNTVGRRNFNGLRVTYMRGPSSDIEAAAVEAALVYGAAGFLVVRRNLSNDIDWAAAQKVEVYPVQVKNPNPADVAPNENQTVEVGFTLTGEPKGFGDFATVAAGA